MDTLFSISTAVILSASVAALFFPALPMMLEAGLLIFGFRHTGIAIIDEVERWKGRPVNTGEAILKVANPDIVKVRILLPVSDAITLQQGTPVKVFLDIDPLHPLHAITEHASYEPVTTPDGTVAYHIIAQLSEHNNPPRIGLQGSAKIYGEEVSLFYYLFRRPITALRQWLGW